MAVPQGGCLAPSCQPSVLGKLLPTQGNRPGPIRRQGPCQEEALWSLNPVVSMRHHSSVPSWAQHLPVEASTSTLSPTWEMPPIPVPLCQHLLVRCPPPHPYSHPTVLQGYKTPAANTVGNKPGFPLLAFSRSLRKPAPGIRVSS